MSDKDTKSYTLGVNTEVISEHMTEHARKIAMIKPNEAIRITGLEYEDEITIVDIDVISEGTIQ